MKARYGKKDVVEAPIGERAGRVSFVMTLWLEPQETAAEPEWRWRVRHVQTGEQSYFRRLGDVLAFVASRSGIPSPR